MRCAQTKLPWMEDVPVMSGERQTLPFFSAQAMAPLGSCSDTIQSTARSIVGHSSARKSTSPVAQ